MNFNSNNCIVELFKKSTITIATVLRLQVPLQVVVWHTLLGNMLIGFTSKSQLIPFSNRKLLFCFCGFVKDGRLASCTSFQPHKKTQHCTFKIYVFSLLSTDIIHSQGLINQPFRQWNSIISKRQNYLLKVSAWKCFLIYVSINEI